MNSHEPTKKAAARRGTQLLVVEDDPADTRMIADMLRRAPAGSGFSLTPVTTLADAMRELSRATFDAVLLDLTVPDASGLELVTRVRESAPTTPLIVLTGNDDVHFAVQAVNHEAQDYLVKWDFNQPQLVRSIRYAIEREQAEQRLRQAKLAAERESESKTQFLAMASHEIRTPMNTVLGMAELLAGETALTPTQQDRLARLRRAGDHLIALLDDLLDLSRAQSGRLELERLPFAVDTLLADVLAFLQPQASAKGLRLVLHRDPTIPHGLRGDPRRLRQILINLLGNGIKFTDAGEVTLRVSRATRGEAPGSILFEVEDTGVGIPADKLDTIFAPFVQGDASTSRRHGGAGLGLSIAKHLTEAMNGAISVESSPSRGTRFLVRIPFEVDESSAPVSEHEDAASAADVTRALSERRPALRVLVTDDSSDNRLLIEDYLADVPMVVYHAESGAACLDEMRTGQFDLVLLDLHMPEMDGFETVRQVRRLERNTGRSPVPVLALSADALQSTADSALGAGCTGFLAKPVRKLALLRAISSLTQLPAAPVSSERVFLESSTSVSDLAAVDATFDPSKIEPDVMPLLPRFVDNRLLDATRLEDALRLSDWATIKTIGHNMKGTGAAYGLRPISSFGEEVEFLARERDSVALGALIPALRAYLRLVQHGLPQSPEKGDGPLTFALARGPRKASGFLRNPKTHATGRRSSSGHK